MRTQNHRRTSYAKMAERFWNQEIKELKENSVNQNTEKRTSTWLNVCTSWAETNLLAYEAKQLDENKHMALIESLRL